MALPQRKRNRLCCFDYSSPGVYFVTICTQNRKNLLCSIVGDGSTVPKPPGQIAEQWIRKIPEKYPSVCVDKCVVMPNHVHILLRITWSGDVTACESGTVNPSPTLGNIIGWYKYHTTKSINQHWKTKDEQVFQRSYHDHVIRTEKDYQMIWQYIDANPLLWKKDCFYTAE